MAEYHSAKFQVQSATLPEFRKGGHNVPSPRENTRPKKLGTVRVKCSDLFMIVATNGDAVTNLIL